MVDPIGWLTPAHVDFVRSMAEASAAILTFIIVAHRIPFFWSKMRLANELQAERGKSSYLKSALEAAIAGSNGWQAAVEAVAQRVQAMQEELHRFDHRLGTAVRYIADLIDYNKNSPPGAKMPRVPSELEEEVNRRLEET